jgi:hypothetical protein
MLGHLLFGSQRHVGPQYVFYNGDEISIFSIIETFEDSVDIVFSLL